MKLVPPNTTSGPWAVGRTLLTRITSRWNAEQLARNERLEKTRIFAFFSAADEGRSRICVATTEVPQPQITDEQCIANAVMLAAAPDGFAALADLMMLTVLPGETSTDSWRRIDAQFLAETGKKRHSAQHEYIEWVDAKGRRALEVLKAAGYQVVP